MSTEMSCVYIRYTMQTDCTKPEEPIEENQVAARVTRVRKRHAILATIGASDHMDSRS